ncbi:MAG: glycoside hydrolase family 127 protein, partial [Clostridia bacterium]|nr:glycoside hydrolase family 127 protein [Clostridia bacterium]
MKEYQPISYMQTDVTGGFWADRQKLIRDVTIFAVRDRFAETGRFRAFKFDWTEGSDIPKPHFFWDSDIAKWLESAAYLLQKAPNAELEAQVEEVIDDIEAHQDKNGYFNIYHTVAEPENRFRIRDHHELYCLGHLIEAGVAYEEATGRGRLLDVLDRYIDYVIRVFTVERSAGFRTPGHEEIELALFRLYRLRHDK